MPRERRLRSRKEFAAVYERGRSWPNRLVVLRASPNSLQSSRFGFSVSRRLGNAVARNRVRRRLREAVRLSTIVPGWDMVFIARNQAGQSDYHMLKKAVEDVLRRASFLVEAKQSGPAGSERHR